MIAVARVSSVLGWTKAAHQASASSFWMRRSGEAGQLIGLALLVDVEVFEALGEWRATSAARLARTALVTGMPAGPNRSCWPWRLGGFLLLQGGADLAVVAFDGLESLVGDAFGEQVGGDAEQGVADADVLVQVGQRLAGFQGFQPERDLSQFGGHGLMSTP